MDINRYGEDGEYAINAIKPETDKPYVWCRKRRRELKEGWQAAIFLVACAAFVWFAVFVCVRWYCEAVLWFAGLLGV